MLTSVHSSKDIRIYFKECISLAKAGYEVHFIVPNAPANETNDGVTIHSFPQKKSHRFLRMTSTVLKIYKKAKKVNANLYHFHDPELIPIALLLRVQQKKVVYDVHEDVPRQILNKYWIKKPLRKIISWLFEKVENFTTKRFNAIVAATPQIEQRFIKIGCKVANVCNYPLLNELTADQDCQRELAVCYIGGITLTRGIKEIILALKDTKAKLLLAGEFSPKDLKNELVNIDGWEKVEELGQLNRDEVKLVLNRSIAGLVTLHPIPNYIESLPIKMFEYMSAGIPVIASNFPLWKKILTENKCGVCVDPLNPIEIADAINYFIDNPNEAKSMGDNGRKAIETKFNWEKEFTKLSTLSKSL